MKLIFTPSLRRYIGQSLLVAAALAPASAFGVPAYPGVIQAEQPDGTLIPIILKGDERGHRAMTSDGFLLMRDAKGYLTYAQVDTEGFPMASTYRASAPEMRGSLEQNFLSTLNRKAIENAYEKSDNLLRAAREAGVNQRYLCSGAAFPASESPHALVVLVEFKDNQFSMEDPHDFYSRMLNEEGFADYNATGSARDFFVENSNGVFTPHFDVYGPIKLAFPMRHYGANDTYGQDVAPEQMVIEACTQLDDDVDFSIYDTNGDGQIDNVFVFYAGYGEADSYKSETIWPHSADMLEFGLTDENGDPKHWYFDGVELNRYGMTNEIDYNYRRPDGIGTFVHEFSHVMGLPDIYATDYTSSFTPGAYCTLDMGPYNNNGRTPPHYGAFERYCLDWLDPEELTLTGDYELEAIHKSNKAYIITTEKPDEFFLLENRQQECCDAYIPGHGMLVWHVDYVESIWNKNIVNNTPSHQYVDLLEADNKRVDTNRDGDPFPGVSNITSLSDRTRPELLSWSGERVAVSLSDIREEDGKILFHAKGKTAEVEAVEEVGISAGLQIEGDRVYNHSGEEAIVYDLTGRKVATINAGESIKLSAGLYVVNADGESLKVQIR